MKTCFMISLLKLIPWYYHTSYYYTFIYNIIVKLLHAFIRFWLKADVEGKLLWRKFKLMIYSHFLLNFNINVHVLILELENELTNQLQHV